ncbi:Hypothetical predicted protein [Cloeon dipterum]|uniref:Gustatory receptor n=1 Tax=Cloeon dipterum TaxID=197152 RepID=A0A8S1BWG5_9INSE|nr:Hypothetical predicted protein [Cloeon dipterum]
MILPKLKELVTYMNNWMIYERELESKLGETFSSSKLSMSKKIKCFYLFGSAFVSINILVDFIVHATPPKFDHLLHGLGLYFVSFIICFWIISCRYICIVSQILLRTLKKSETLNVAFPNKRTEKSILGLRNLWFCLISDLAAPLGNSFSYACGIVIVNTVVNITYFTLQFVTVYSKFEDAGSSNFYLIFLVLFSSQLVIIFVEAEKARITVLNCLQGSIEQTTFLKTRKQTKKFLIRFFSKAIVRAPQISLDGYFTVNRQSLGQIVVSVLSNVIIIFQFGIKQRNYETVEQFLQIIVETDQEFYNFFK